ncbi:MAG: ATP-binding protein [archaeon]
MSEELIVEIKEFLDYHKKNIGKYAKSGEKAIQISFLDVLNFSHELAEELLNKTEETLASFELALDELELIKKAKVRLKDLPKSVFVRIRDIRSKHLNQLLTIDGIVKQASEVRPQVTNAKFECPSCGTVISVLQVDKKFAEPSRCSCGRKSAFRLVSKELVDTQRLVIEESPETLVGGEQPRRISVFLKEDLVNPRMEERTSPGTRILIGGLLTEVPIPLQGGGQSTRYDLAIEANNITPLEETFERLEISEEEEDEIKELAADPEVYEKLAASVAPSIFGYDEIKLAVALQLMGGIKKTRSDGTAIRGDMHILLVGDPGVAKSVLLKFVSNIAPKGRYIVGKSTSGAGLTATVIRDEFLRGWALEAGAMVLANKGVCCIDEMEKMSEEDRSAMHEALEQQTVTISKANVQACYSQDTEVLTNEGWRKYGDVGTLKIAQYNPENKEILFLPHNGLYVYDYNGKMYHFKNKRNDILVTPNHTMLVKPEKKKKYEKINAEDINSYRFHFLNSGNFVGKEVKNFILPGIKHKQNRKHPKYTHRHKSKKIPMDLWLEFLGYYITEGGIETIPTIGIVQKKGEDAEKIRRCLKKLVEILGCSLSQIDCGKYIRLKITQTQLYEHLKKLGHKCYEKKLELDFSKLSKRQIKILHDAMMLGGGSSKGEDFGSTSEKLIDEMQAIVCLIGKSACKSIQYSEGTRGKRKTMHRVSLCDKTELIMKKSSVKKEKYNGKVFCFSTNTGFFVTRRNGKVAIQGNTLTCETSVIGAANPKFGRFDPYQPVASQINMAPSLINRFDLIFILKDLPEKIKDEAIATQVLSEHRQTANAPPISQSLLKKYIAYVKQKIFPKLTDVAVEEIKRFYVELRNSPSVTEDLVRPIPISARQLEALIRLSEASARARLSKTITKEDAKRAIRIMHFYLLQVGIDKETGQIDIDRITSGISASERSKIVIMRDTLIRLESRTGKLIPFGEIREELKEKIDETQISELIDKLKRAGDIFEPKKGFIQRI